MQIICLYINLLDRALCTRAAPLCSSRSANITIVPSYENSCITFVSLWQRNFHRILSKNNEKRKTQGEAQLIFKCLRKLRHEGHLLRRSIELLFLDRRPDLPAEFSNDRSYRDRDFTLSSWENKIWKNMGKRTLDIKCNYFTGDFRFFKELSKQ